MNIQFVRENKHDFTQLINQNTFSSISQTIETIKRCRLDVQFDYASLFIPTKCSKKCHSNL